VACRGNLCPSGHLLPAGCAGSGIVSGVGARARLTLEGAGGAADQRAPVAGRMADSQLGRDGYAGFSSISDVNLYFFIAPDVAARVEHRSYTDMRNELGYGCAPGCGERFISIRAISRSIPSRPNGARATPGIHAFIGSQCYPGALRGLPAPVLLAPACGALQPRYGAFRNLLSPEGFRRMSRLIAYMGPVSGEITLAKTYPWIAAEKAAFVAVLLGLYLLAARESTAAKCTARVCGCCSERRFTFSPSQRRRGSGNRCALQAAGHACRLRPRAAGFLREEKVAQQGESSAFESKSPGRLAPWNAFDEFLPRRTPGKPGSLSLGRG